MSKTTVTQHLSRIALAGFALATLSAGTAQAAPLPFQTAAPAATVADTTGSGNSAASGSSGIAAGSSGIARCILGSFFPGWCDARSTPIP
ncbi:hypothetical protein [Nocardia sp. NPDC006630]|uniref:hypothetical protein n=1 Tax=Nocardia sp. NPDC006630 TaxID=3157181 RepID=UPI0033B12A43